MALAGAVQLYVVAPPGVSVVLPPEQIEFPAEEVIVTFNAAETVTSTFTLVLHTPVVPVTV